MEQWQTVDWSQVLVCSAAAYALGCFATGYYLVRARTSRDIREIESGSIGARNVGRLLGKAGFLLTVLGDFAKGYLAVWAVHHFKSNGVLTGLAMLAVVAGHIWPVQLGFRGGKGVATSLGALLVCDHWLAFAYAVVFLGGFIVTRKTILPGLFAYAVLPLTSFWLDHDGAKAIVITVLSAMVILAHRRNIIEEIPALAARFGVEPKPEHPKL